LPRCIVGNIGLVAKTLEFVLEKCDFWQQQSH